MCSQSDTCQNIGGVPILYHDDCVNSEGRISTGASVDRFLAPLGESDAIVNEHDGNFAEVENSMFPSCPSVRRSVG
jgi:hypothetical protein